MKGSWMNEGELDNEGSWIEPYRDRRRASYVSQATAACS